VIEALAPRAHRWWHYWRARALEALGRDPEARAAFGELAKNLGYYGFLAADRLEASHAVRSRPIAYSKEDLRALEGLPGLVRARELYLLDMSTEARAEWDQTLRDADPDRLQAAAVLAHRWGWHDRAIAAAARGGYLEDLELRFLAYRSRSCPVRANGA
jgi:soluble lytic murein transglycosylase